jgi:signal transduction histidine kinase
VRSVTAQPIREIVITTRAGKNAEISILIPVPNPEEILSKIGFDLIEKPEDAQGLGIGLLMSQTIVQTYGGDIHVASTGPEGTTMVIALPLEKSEDTD